MCALFWWENLKERENFQDLGTNGMILHETKQLQSTTVLACSHNDSDQGTQ